MDTLVPMTAGAVLVALLFLALAASAYTRVAARLVREGGHVRVASLGLPELLMGIVLASFFVGMMFLAMRHQAIDPGSGVVDIDVVIPSSILFLTITAGIAGFMKYRGLPLTELFGLRAQPPLVTFGWAIGLIAAALPLVGAANWLIILAMREQLAPQPLVQLFSKVARESDFVAMGKIFVSGVLIQPACEEFLFRGFFYGVGKRYCGALASGFFCSVLFAAFHTNLAALPGLFVLAVCLNLAYERTGTLLVPICMHALYNFFSLTVLFLVAKFAPAVS